MPDYIREHLPEELSDLPAALIYATNLAAHEFSSSAARSAAARRSAEARARLGDEIRALCGDRWMSMQWPGWAVDAAMLAHDDYVRPHQMQEEAMRWVQEHRCPMPASSSSASDEGAGEEADEEADEEAGQRSGRRSSSEDDDGPMVVDLTGEEAGEEYPQNNPSP